MDSLVISGVPPYDGEYELDWAGGFTNGEYRQIKKDTGLRGGELQEAMEAGDIDVLVAVAIVALTRAGLEVDMATLDAATPASFKLNTADAEDEDRPPATATTGGEENKPAGVAETSSEPEPSGSPGTETGASSQPDPSPTGSPG